MKRVLTLIFAIFMIFQLSSCKITIEKELELGCDINDIVAINIYEVEREEYIGSQIDDSVLDIRDQYEPVYILKDEEIDAFISELLTLEYARDEMLIEVANDVLGLFLEKLIKQGKLQEKK